jgi:hypothetical protein
MNSDSLSVRVGAPLSALCGALLTVSCSSSEPQSIALFDGQTLAGWQVARAEGDGLPAEQIFTVDAEGIHVYAGASQGSTQPIATLVTELEYSHFVLEFEYKWGQNRFGERSDTARDAGVLFHVHTSPSQIWPPSLEMQMGTSELDGRWVTGDAFILGGGTRATVQGQVATEGRFRTTVRAEKPEGEWNQLRLTVNGSESATYELNGTELNSLGTFEKDMGGAWVPLDRGRIALQAEYAELWYRNIRLQEL